MGNGQNRNRRGGARTRHGPHRGGAGSGDRRSATHVMPPTLMTPTDTETEASVEAPPSGAPIQMSAATEKAMDAAQAAETAEEQFERRAGELLEGPASPAPEPEPGIEVAAAAPPTSAPPATASPARLPETANAQAETPGEAPREAPRAERELEEVNADPERRAPRGRFERFYAPGQTPRVERNGHGATAANGAGNGAHAGLARPTRDQPPTFSPSAAQVPEEEEELRPSGPREDVRGAVGGLIDALHDLFTQDRAVATQGGSSRCGLCYLHFPIGELVYRESEGFYVCQACERALGPARINMVRRQQKL